MKRHWVHLQFRFEAQKDVKLEMLSGRTALSSNMSLQLPPFVVETLRHYKRKSVEVGMFQRGVGHFECKFHVEGAWLPTTVGVRKQTDCPFVWDQNICSALFGFVTKHVCDRWTDRETELQQLIPR